MRLTNNLNLPEAFVRAIQAHPYSKGESDISCTGLIKPPLMVRLEHDYRDELEEDASDRIWALRGTIIHHIIEVGAPDDCLPETRFFAKVNGWILSGQADAYFPKEGLIQDWKETGVYSTREGPKPDWVAQLNILAYLIRRNGGEVNRLEIVVMYRDWKIREAKRSQNYPEKRICKLPVVLWPEDKIQEYIETRIELHKEALDVPEITMIPECTPEERWEKPSVWAIMKKGRKSAIPNGLHQTKEDAEIHLKELSDQHYIEFRPGERTRCEEGYCVVKQWCPYFKQVGDN
jgi:hypothetical protein